MANRWTRQRITIEFSGFPRCIAYIVAEFCMIPHLLPWIDPERLDTITLCVNPGAIESKMIADMRFCDIEWLGRNSAAAEYIKSQPQKFLHCNSCWENPVLFDWMMKHAFISEERFKWEHISNNTNPDAIKHILESNPEDGDNISLANPLITMSGLWEYIMSKANTQKSYLLYANPSAIDDGVCCNFDDDKYGYLSSNPHPRAIEYLSTHQNKIRWYLLSQNPAIFQYRVDPELVATLSE